METDDMQKAIANELGIAELSQEEQKDLIAQFGEVALKSSMVAVLGALPEGKRQEFTTLAAGQDPAAVRAFLDKELPNHDEVARKAVAEEVGRFKEFQKTAVA